MAMKTIAILFLAVSAFGADTPVDRWAKAVGGREKIAPIKALYREATIDVGDYHGWIKAWHTSDGKYRKEEQIAIFSTIETFDGTDGMVQRGAGEAAKMTGAELERAHSNPYANWNAVFLAFFPDRHLGTTAFEGDGTVVLHANGGIDWRVTLDPKTGLPKTMVHKEGDRTVTVDFVSYETIDGIQFEKEIHRSNGNPQFDAVIRFTKTVMNPEIPAGFFSLQK